MLRVHTNSLPITAMNPLCPQPAFLTALANELSNVGKSDVARMAAGLQLKNYLTSKAVEVKVHLQQRWLGMDLTVRQHIKIAVSIQC